ncbi:MAG: hypothetical protein J6K58_14115 [Lachnospiraceae bacterium]|nr:hypothetical protein [Lachnospiraceae bacterium]
MKAQILGITSYMKNDNVNYTLHCVSEFSDYDKKNGATGYKVSTVWTNSVDCSTLVQGDIVDLHFEPGFNNTATLCGFNILPHKSEVPFVNVDINDNVPEVGSTSKGSK